MAEGFKNVVDYVRERWEPFSERPLGRVDSLVFSWLSYFLLPTQAPAAWGWGGMPVKELWRLDWLDGMLSHITDAENSLSLLTAVTASPRFRDVVVCNYVTKTDRLEEMQFSAVTFRLSADETYVAFRGTDNTVLGWKESFNMAFQVAVPSQKQARRYLERVAERTSGTLWCGGHSKGGNLAAYAALSCSPEIRARVRTCYSHDGPGFSWVAASALEGAEGTVRIERTVPRSSVLGMLMDGKTASETVVVRSVQHGVSQHNPLNWEVDGDDFVVVEDLGQSASHVNGSLNAWIAQASLEERERFVEALFEVFGAGDETYFHDLKANWRSTVPRMLSAAVDLEPEARDLVLREVRELMLLMTRGSGQG